MVFRSDAEDDPYTTYDGLPVSHGQPHGATVVVVSKAADGWRYLVLHRAHHGADSEGERAWTPAGARVSRQGIAVCVTRELQEESGLTGSERPMPARRLGSGPTSPAPNPDRPGNPCSSPVPRACAQRGGTRTGFSSLPRSKPSASPFPRRPDESDRPGAGRRSLAELCAW